MRWPPWAKEYAVNCGYGIEFVFDTDKAAVDFANNMNFIADAHDEEAMESMVLCMAEFAPVLRHVKYNVPCGAVPNNVLQFHRKELA